MQFLNRLLKLDGLMAGNDFEVLVLQIDGSELPTVTATTAPFLIGKKVATALDDGSNQVTITFNEKLKAAPVLIGAVTNTADSMVDVHTPSTSSLIYTTVKASDHSSLADVDVTLTLLIPKEKI